MSDMPARRVRRLASLEKVMTERRSAGPSWSMTKHIACFTSASFSSFMLPLTSSTVTRSSGARATSDGALACTSTANLSRDAPLARAGSSHCVANFVTIELSLV